ncbi:DUF4384 domain-containing protein [bacterium]|nr:DUF4384 domain-containing protein [bacterium]
MRYPFLFLLFVIATACSSAEPPQKTDYHAEVRQVLISSSQSDRPEWLRISPSDENGFTFLVGISLKSATEQGATDDAVRNATSQFIKSCGVKVKLFDLYVLTAKSQKTGTAIEQEVSGESREQQRANAFVSGLKIKERYTEKYEVRQGDVWLKNSFFSALLISAPDDECKRIKEWKKQYISELSSKIKRLIDDAKTSEADGQIQTALSTARNTEKTIRESNIDPEEIGYLYATVLTLIEKYEFILLNKEIQSLLASAAYLESDGHIMAALHSLKKAGDLIHETQEKQIPGTISLATVAQEEKRIIGNLELTPLNNINQVIEPGRKPEPLTVGVHYRQQKSKPGLKLGDIPIGFSSKSNLFKTRTDSSGTAELQMTAADTGGLLQVFAAFDVEGIEKELSPVSLGEFGKKSNIRFQIDVRYKTLEEKAAELVEGLAAQIKFLNSEPVPVVVSIGSFQFEGQPGCSSPFLERLKSLINQKATNHQDFKVTGDVKIPRQFPAELDPNIAMDQAKILQHTVLFGRLRQQDQELVLTAMITGPATQVASSSTAFNQNDIDRASITPVCPENEPLLSEILPLQPSDFHFKLWTDRGGNTYKIGDIVEIAIMCSERCYVKIFNIDDQGDIVVLEDTQDSRLIKNRPRSFKIKAVKPGVQTLLAIASTQPFPIHHQINQTIDPGSFPIIYKQLRSNTQNKDRLARKSEYKTALTIFE